VPLQVFGARMDLPDSAVLHRAGDEDIRQKQDR
jgi:hypothetical protein